MQARRRDDDMAVTAQFAVAEIVNVGAGARRLVSLAEAIHLKTAGGFGCRQLAGQRGVSTLPRSVALADIEVSHQQAAGDLATQYGYPELAAVGTVKPLADSRIVSPAGLIRLPFGERRFLLSELGRNDAQPKFEVFQGKRQERLRYRLLWRFTTPWRDWGWLAGSPPVRNNHGSLIFA
jgi:hypothetical protein